METRNFTVIDSDSQVTKVIQSNATTVAELKRDLREAGFSTENKTIQEGVSGIEFKSDDAPLPHDVPYRGTTTNDLVFRLTKANKHISSGSSERAEAYAMIKKNNLEEVVKKTYGKNFTQCSTADLRSVIEKHSAKVLEPTKNTPKKAAPVKKESNNASNNIALALEMLLSTLVDKGTLSYEEGQKIADIISVTLPEPSGIYSKAELDNMFKGMN